MKRLIVNELLKRRTSPGGTALAFVPGQNFVYELNDTATEILDLLSGPLSHDELVEQISTGYDTEDVQELRQDVTMLLERFMEHNIVVEAA